MIELAVTENLGPREMAEKLKERIAELEARMLTATTRREAKAIRARIRSARRLLAFCKSRVGY